MSDAQGKIKIFESQQIRTEWDADYSFPRSRVGTHMDAE